MNISFIKSKISHKMSNKLKRTKKFGIRSERSILFSICKIDFYFYERTGFKFWIILLLDMEKTNPDEYLIEKGCTVNTEKKIGSTVNWDDLKGMYDYLQDNDFIRTGYRAGYTVKEATLRYILQFFIC